VRQLSPPEQQVWDSTGVDADKVVLGMPEAPEVREGFSWGLKRQVRASVLVDLLTNDATGRHGVALIGARIVGSLDLSNMRITIPLFLKWCYFDGDVVLAGATTGRIDLDHSCLAGGLIAPGLVATDSILVTEAHCQKGVWMPGAEIKGTLGFSGTTIGSHGDGALQASHLIARAFTMSGAECNGTLDLRHAYVSGDVTLDGSVIRGTKDIAVHAQALRAASLSCQGDADTDRDFTAVGTVRILDAQVEGTINFAGATLTATENGTASTTANALLADRVRCSAGMFLRNGFSTTGTVSLQGIQVGGQVDCSKAHLTATPFALIADRATIGQDLLLNREFTADGTVHLNGTKVGGQLTFRTATLATTTTGPAVVLDSVEADQLLLDWATVPTGIVDLTGTTVGTLVDNPATWPAKGDLLIGELTYRSLSEPGEVEDRLKWLQRNKFGYSPHAYDVLAESYRTRGDDDAARAVLIGKQRARRERLGRRHAPARWWSTFLRWTVGYGYTPARIVPWFLGLLLVGWALFAGPVKHSLVATNDAAKAQDFEPFLYVLDLLLPVASLGVRTGWTPTGVARWLVVAWTLAGWLLGLTLVAAISGAFKRD
jgi:hypothetical protein